MIEEPKFCFEEKPGCASFSRENYFNLSLDISETISNPISSPILSPISSPISSLILSPISETISKTISETISDETLFAVKTCRKFHQSRLSVVKETWLPFAKNAIVVSEFKDQEFGTIVLPGLFIVLNRAQFIYDSQSFYYQFISFAFISLFLGLDLW